MKRIMLLRHAKSSWKDADLPDYQRPLAERGRDAAPRIGEYLAGKGLLPDAVLCSGARRAIETWELIAPFLGSPRVHIEENLYMAEPEAIINWLRQLDAGIDSVLLIGHNPGFEELAERLSGNGRKKHLKRMRRKYPTGAVAVIRFETDDWSSIGDRGGYLERFIRPADL